MASQTTTPAPSPTTLPEDLTQAQAVKLKDPYTAKVPKEWIGIRMAHEATMVQDASLALKADREQRRQYNAKMLGIEAPAETDDDMAMHIGDVINYPQQSPQPSPTAPAAASGLSNLAKAGIAAAVLGSGGLGALGAKLLATAPAAAVQQVQAGDPGVQLQFYEPPKEANGSANN